MGADGSGPGVQLETLLGLDAEYEATFIEYWGTETPALYTAGWGPAITPCSGYGPQCWSDPPLAHALFDVRGESGCELHLLAEWEVEDARIAGEEIFYEISSLRRCAALRGLDLPEGWWTDWGPPDPLVETVTARVPTGDGAVIDIVSGSVHQTELARWGLDRFAAAGLAAPRIDTISFPPFAELCGPRDAVGYAILHATGARVDLCLRDPHICDDSMCDPFSTAARFGVLHEFAHIWEYQRLDEATRQAFLDQRGLDVWSNHEGAEEGAEVAADIIAWGLMDQSIPVARISDADPVLLAAGFRLLTGAEPLFTGPGGY